MSAMSQPSVPSRRYGRSPIAEPSWPAAGASRCAPCGSPGLAVDLERELLGAEALRREPEQQQHLGVPAGELDAPPPDVHDAAVASERGDGERRHRPGGRIGVGRGGELMLDRARGEVHDGERVRMGGGEVAREVDDAEERTGRRIVHGRRGARPAVHGGREVLGGEDLERVMLGEGRTHGVGACRLLAPHRAELQVHLLRALDEGRLTVEPEQGAVGVADERDVIGVADIVEQPAQDWHGDGQRVLGPAPRDLLLGHLDGRKATPGIEPGGARPCPRALDHLPNRYVAGAPRRLGFTGREPAVVGARQVEGSAPPVPPWLRSRPSPSSLLSVTDISMCNAGATPPGG